MKDRVKEIAIQTQIGTGIMILAVVVAAAIIVAIGPGWAGTC